MIIGQFLDSAVTGLTFKDAESNVLGVTDAEGLYECAVGSKVFFSIGDVELGASNCQPLTSPFDIVDIDANYFVTSIQIARFLQTLDSDNDPNNGIDITQQTATRLVGSDFSFNNLSLFENELQTWLTDNTDLSLTLVSAADAANHMNQFYRNTPQFNGKRCEFYSPTVKELMRAYNPSPDCSEYKQFFIYQTYIKPDLVELGQSLADLNDSALGEQEELEEQVKSFVGIGDALVSTINTANDIGNIASDEARSAIVKSTIVGTKVVRTLVNQVINLMELVDPNFELDEDTEQIYKTAISKGLDAIFAIESCYQNLNTSSDKLLPTCIDSAIRAIRIYAATSPRFDEKDIATIEISLGRVDDVLAIKKLIDGLGSIQEDYKLLKNQSKLASGLFIANTVISTNIIREGDNPFISVELIDDITDTLANLTSIVDCFKNTDIRAKSVGCINAATGVVSQYINAVGEIITAVRITKITEQVTEVQVIALALENYVLHGGRGDLISERYGIGGPIIDINEYLDVIGANERDYNEATVRRYFDLYLNQLTAYAASTDTDWGKIFYIDTPPKVFVGQPVSIQFDFTAPSQYILLLGEASGIEVWCYADDTNSPLSLAQKYTHLSDDFFSIRGNLEIQTTKVGIIQITCDVRSPLRAARAVVARANRYIAVIPDPNRNIVETVISYPQSNSSIIQVIGKDFDEDVQLRIDGCNSEIVQRDVNFIEVSCTAVDVSGKSLRIHKSGVVLSSHEIIVSVNILPVADIVPLNEVVPGELIELSAINSYDPDGEIITYSWKQISGPTLTLANASAETTTFTAPNVDEDSTIHIMLSVTDNRGGVNTSSIMFTVLSRTATDVNEFVRLVSGPWTHNGRVTTAQDDFGNIYIAIIAGSTAESENGVKLMKFDAVGSLIWDQLISGNESTFIADIEVSPLNNIAVIGRTTSTTFEGIETGRLRNSSVGFISIINANGEKLWTDILDTNDDMNSLANPTSVAFDSSSGIYVTGSTSSNYKGQSLNGSSDVFISKFSHELAGTEAWHKLVGGNGGDSNPDIHINGLDLFITFTTFSNELFGVANTLRNAAAYAKFTLDGNFEWGRLIDEVGDGVGHRLASSSDGRNHLIGRASGGRDFFITDFTSDGTINSINMFEMNGFGSTTNAFASLGSDGFIYLSFYYANSIFGIPILGRNDAFFAKFRIDGSLVWVKRFGGDSNEYIGSDTGLTFESHSVNSNGRLVLGGTTDSSSFEGISTSEGTLFIVVDDANNP